MLSIHDDGPPPPCPVPFNMAHYVLSGGATQPDKIALAIVGPSGAERWSFARLERAVRGVATGLIARGLAPGDRVLLRLGNTVDFPIAFLGSIAAGLLPVPSSAQLTQTEITPMAADLAPALIIADDGIALPEHRAPVIDRTEMERWFDLPPADYAMGAPDRPAYIIFTSGSGGRTRGVLHAHRAVWARRMMWDGWYGLTAGDRLMHAGAFNWTYTLGTGLMDPWAAGATALIPATGVAPAALPLLMKRYDATLFAAAPGVFRQMLKAPSLPALPKLRHALSAGEKLPPELRARWNAATGTMIYEALGMSECSTFISGAPSRPAPPGASGYPQIGRRVAVLGDDMAPVRRGQPGQLAIGRRDPGLMLGYWNDEAETAARRHEDWFLTGDMVEMAADGAVTYLGRSDDMMNAGGYRVSPLEVEAALCQHPQVQEAAATELRVKADASVIGLFYTGDRLDGNTLSSFAAEHLSRYKQPRLYIHMQTLPRGGNGKLNRRALRQSWEAEHGQT